MKWTRDPSEYKSPSHNYLGLTPLRFCSVSGEIELDIAMFGSHSYSIGIAFSCPEIGGDKPIEWNQDPLHTAYHRPRSFIHMAERLIVDETCFLKFRIDVPASLFPTGASRVYAVDVRCYALSSPEVVTKPSNVQFMILNRSGKGGAGRRPSVGM